MGLRSSIRLLALLLLAVAAVLGARRAILRGIGHSVSAAPLAAKPATVAPANQPTQRQPQASSDSSDPKTAFASLAEAEVSQLHEGVTLAQWVEQHSNGEGWESSTDKTTYECRTFVKTETVPFFGTQITRTIYFYPPAAPTPAVFPTLTGEEAMDRGCMLAMIRIQMRTPAEQDGHAFAQALKRQLVTRYGASTGAKGAVFSGDAAWEDSGRWKGTAEIVSAYNPTAAGYAREDPDAGSVFVLARLPVVYEIEQNGCCRMKAYRYRSIESAQFDRAVAIAGLDAALSRRVLKLYQALAEANVHMELGQKPEITELRDAVLPALRDWLGAGKALTPDRRAASLYAADRLLVVANDMGWQDLVDEHKPDRRSVFHAIGANFEFDELGKCYNYSGNWLSEARELDPDGPVGRMAVLVSLARGGAPQLEKDKNKDADTFRTVVIDGEWLLAKNPDPSTAAQIHFMMGDAYSDVVALAGGAEPDYGDPVKYEGEADTARQKALEHYRAGLAFDGTSENAKDAWLQAWHLSAGLLPSTRYVYIYD